MSSEATISYRIAMITDRDEIAELFNTHFYPNEPFNSGWINDDAVPEDLDFTLASLDENASIVAIDDETNRIVGACITGVDTPAATESVIDESKKTTNKKWSQYLRLYAQLDIESRIFQRFNVNESFHVHGLVVDANYRNHSIGTKLMEKCYQLGASRGYKVCSVNCSSVFTEKIAIKLKMSCVRCNSDGWCDR